VGPWTSDQTSNLTWDRMADLQVLSRLFGVAYGVDCS
jgi:hypothetical protein